MSVVEDDDSEVDGVVQGLEMGGDEFVFSVTFLKKLDDIDDGSRALALEAEAEGVADDRSDGEVPQVAAFGDKLAGTWEPSELACADEIGGNVVGLNGFGGEAHHVCLLCGMAISRSDTATVRDNA